MLSIEAHPTDDRHKSHQKILQHFDSEQKTAHLSVCYIHERHCFVLYHSHLFMSSRKPFLVVLICTRACDRRKVDHGRGCMRAHETAARARARMCTPPEALLAGRSDPS